MLQLPDELLETDGGFILPLVERGKVICVIGKLIPKGIVDEIRNRP